MAYKSKSELIPQSGIIFLKKPAVHMALPRGKPPRHYRPHGITSTIIPITAAFIFTVHISILFLPYIFLFYGE